MYDNGDEHGEHDYIIFRTRFTSYSEHDERGEHDEHDNDGDEISSTK